MDWCQKDKQIKMMRYFSGFKFQPNVCDRWIYFLMMSFNLSNIAILNLKGSDYRCIISLLGKIRS